MIPVEQIAGIRARHELVAFIESAGVTLRRRGRDLVGLCPFHDDREPSLSVSPAKQYWCCLGACSAGNKKAGGDVIEFARRLWRTSFRETLDRLNGGNGNGSSPPAPKRLPKRSAPPVRPAPHDLLTQVAHFYHQTFAASAAAKEYLTSRGITSADVIAALPIGYADGSLLERAPEGSETHGALTTLGVLAANGHELMEGCVVIPLRDLAGSVVGLYGRATERDAHLYLPGPRRGLMNAQAAATTSEIVITESVFDALSFIEAGIANVVPMYGTNGWTSDHDALVEQHRIRSIVLALDNDEAGQRATQALAAKLSERGIDVRTVALPAKDANELLVRDGAEQLAATWKQLTAAKEEVAAAPSPAAAAIDTSDGGYVIAFAHRTWRIRGLSVNGVDRLRVNVRVDQDERFHIETFDLYAARSRRHFLDEVATALTLADADRRELQTEVARVIERLESERLALRAKGKDEKPQPQAMSASKRDEAMEMLRDAKLVDRIREDFTAAGCVGESDAMLVAYLAALSRKLDEPLAVLFCAQSGAGKSSLQERITDLVPPEDLVRYSRITGQALFYQDEDALKHKVLALDEEGGAADAIYSLRILQSSGTLSVSSTRTDPQTGKHRAEHYEVHGPTSIFLTTAHPEALDYETRNRFVVLTADESQGQTRRILEQQRWSETLEGLVAKKKREAVIRRHRNAQRLIEPLHVINPHAPSLTFPSSRLILRREQKKYLALIRAIALLHQHQRRAKTIDVGGETLRYIEVAPSDIALAQQLGAMILRRDLDELAPPTRSLLTTIGELVAKKMDELKVPQEFAHLTRQEIQQATGLSYWHLRVYLGQLTECEYLAAVRGEQGKRYLYELLWDGVEDDPAAELVPRL